MRKEWSSYMNSLKRANYSTLNYVTIGHFYPSHVWKLYFYVVVQSFSCIWLFMTPWTAACQASLSFTVSQSLLNPMYIKSLMPSNYLILCHPLLLLSSIFPSNRVFSSVLAVRIRWTKYWSFIFSISLSSEYLGLIYFRIDWFNLCWPMDSRVFSTLQNDDPGSLRES